jgi:hypothetical protein
VDIKSVEYSKLDLVEAMKEQQLIIIEFQQKADSQKRH